MVEIATRLDRRRWEPRVYCLSGPGKLAERLTAADVPVRPLGASSRRDLRVISRLRSELHKFRPELLQTFLFHANMAGRIAAWRTGVSVVVSGIRVIEQDARWRMHLDRRTKQLVSHTVCVSEAVAAAYRSLGFPNPDISVIRNGVDIERFAAAPADLAEFGIPANAQTWLAVGRLHPQKGFDVLVDAVGPVLDANADMHLLIVGEGQQRPELERRILASAHSERMHLVGRREDVPSLMRACDAFVLSSRWEGMPNVILEAMAAGLPVVATDVEGVREIVIDGKTGIVVERTSAEALSVGIQRLMSTDDAQQMGSAGRQRVTDQFSWPQAVDAYDRLYQQLLTSAAKPQ